MTASHSAVLSLASSPTVEPHFPDPGVRRLTPVWPDDAVILDVTPHPGYLLDQVDMRLSPLVERCFAVHRFARLPHGQSLITARRRLREP